MIAKEIQVKQYKTKTRKRYKSSEEDLDVQRMEIPAEKHLTNREDLVHDTEDPDRTMYSRQMTRVPSVPINRNDMVHDTEDLEKATYSQQRTATQSAPRNTDMVHKLGTDTLTTLGRVNTARVIIERLLLTDDGQLENQSSSRKLR